MLSNHLSETASQDQPANEDALTQIFDLPDGEEIIGLYKKAFSEDSLTSRTTQSSAISDAALDEKSEADGTQDGSNDDKSSIGGTHGEGSGVDARSDVPEELLEKIESHSVLDGCVLVTDAAIYQCKPRYDV